MPPAWFDRAADLVVLLHAAFVVFVVTGGLLVLRWRSLAWLHVPAAIWGAVVELTGWICPLTPLENHLRALAGRPTYQDDFIEHYVMPLLYPADLTRTQQLLFGGLVIVVNAAVYWRVLRTRRSRTDRT